MGHKEIEADSLAGRLDSFVREARDEKAKRTHRRTCRMHRATVRFWSL